MSGTVPLLRAVLFEAGAALIFFGVFIHNAALEKSGGEALAELAARGYTLAADPVRVYPAKTGGAMSGVHAGGWRPGVISLRERPEGSSPEVFLRHELMHEASFRTCGGRLPIWAEEAAAMSFSGELADPLAPGERPGPSALSALGSRIRSGAALDRETYRALALLVAIHGWPTAPCAVSESIEQELAAVAPMEDTGFAGILIHLYSGRILEAQGDGNTRHPPGSLLKIPFAAALKDGDTALLGEELARSDTVALLRRRGALDLDRYRFFLSPVAEAPLGRPVAPPDAETFWRRYLGERDADGSFPFTASLPELAKVLRASLLFRPEPFAGLSQNGFLTGSTLAAQPEEERQSLARLHALAKTGTVSDARDKPLIGHLMVAWPAERPVFLAVFRGFGTAGAAVLRQAAPLLDEWAARHPVEYGTVRVRLMSLLPRGTWQIVDESPVFTRPTTDGATLRVSTDGRFRILSTARKSKTERLIAGVLECSADEQTVVETDAETYAEGVLAAEAQDLPGEAKKAMAAVIVWNGVHGGHRHPESGALCDSTHCMVFLGEQEKTAAVRNVFPDLSLFSLLSRLTAEDGSPWFSFAKGGDKTWTRRIPAADLTMLAGESQILDIRRERTRSGAVMVHLHYPENEETVPCELFRNTMKLLSCPDTISFEPKGGGTWVFSGIGEGHGEGLSMERARALAEAGRTTREIILDAYGEKSP